MIERPTAWTVAAVIAAATAGYALATGDWTALVLAVLGTVGAVGMVRDTHRQALITERRKAFANLWSLAPYIFADHVWQETKR